MLAKSRFRIGFYGVFGSCGFVDSIKEKAEETPTGAQNERPKRRKPQHREAHDQKAKNDPENGPSWPQVEPKSRPNSAQVGPSYSIWAELGPNTRHLSPCGPLGGSCLGPWVGRGVAALPRPPRTRTLFLYRLEWTRALNAREASWSW